MGVQTIGLSTVIPVGKDEMLCFSFDITCSAVPVVSSITPASPPALGHIVILFKRKDEAQHIKEVFATVQMAPREPSIIARVMGVPLLDAMVEPI